ESELGAAKLEPKELIAPTFLGSVKTILTLLVMMPLAIAGAIIHYPIYRLIGFAVKGDEELIATQKAVGGLVLFPLTWIACAALAWWRFGWPIALAVLLILPILGYIALRFFEQLDGVVGRARALTWRVARRRAYARLLAQQRAIHDEIVELDEAMARSDHVAGSPAVATGSSRRE